MREGNVLLKKSEAFAIRCVKLYQYLVKEKKEFILSKQLLRSGTSVGANVTTNFLTPKENESILNDCNELLRLLQAITKTLYNK